jgi:hypothetical protein
VFLSDVVRNTHGRIAPGIRAVRPTQRKKAPINCRSCSVVKEAEAAWIFSEILA